MKQLGDRENMHIFGQNWPFLVKFAEMDPWTQIITFLYTREAGLHPVCEWAYKVYFLTHPCHFSTLPNGMYFMKQLCAGKYAELAGFF